MRNERRNANLRDGLVGLRPTHSFIMMYRSRTTGRRIHTLCCLLAVPCLLWFLLRARSRETNAEFVEEQQLVHDESLVTKSLGNQPGRTTTDPLLVLHIGPGKTGTTSLQVDLTKPEIVDSLRQDGYWYGGRYYNNTHYRKSGRFVEGKESFSPVLNVLREILIPAGLVEPTHECHGTNDCWKFFRSMIDQESQKRHLPHMLISDEPLALRWTQDRFSILRDLLNSTGSGSGPPSWRPLVVVSYRKFYEWLPSSIYQRNRKRLHATEWPTNGDLHALQQLWPNMVTEWREHHYTFVDSLIDQASAADVDYRVLNIHLSDTSMRTQFLCHILPYAPHACSTSRQWDDEQEQAHVNSRRDETVELVYQDMVVTEAAARGWVDRTKYTRPDMREALRLHLQHKTLQELYPYCPTKTQLEALLQQSLDLESKYIIATSSHLESIRKHLEAEHMDGFEQMVDRKGFCVLDVDAALKQLRHSFFEAFAP